MSGRPLCADLQGIQKYSTQSLERDNKQYYDIIWGGMEPEKNAATYWGLSIEEERLDEKFWEKHVEA